MGEAPGGTAGRGRQHRTTTTHGPAVPGALTMHLHRGVWVEALGDGVADEGLAFLAQQFDEPLLLGDQSVDLCRLAVQKIGDGLLFGGWGEYNLC